MSNPVHILTLVVAVGMAALDGTGGLTPALAQSSETAKLLPSAGAPGDEFGYSVAVDGDTAVIGARYDDDLDADSGSAYVFRFDGYDWVQEAKLLPSDGEAGDWFGRSVAIHADTIVVGAHGDDDLGDSYGSAYVFRFDGDNWVQEAKLLPGDAPPGDSSSHPGFGYNVAIDGETIAVAAQGKDELGVDSGSVYVFVRDGAVWNQQAKLLPSDGATWEYFGQSIAIHGDDIVVGTWGGGSSPIHAGSAYVFVRSGTTWTQQVKLVAPDAAAGDHFGVSVDIDGDTVVAGAYADERGSTHVFVRSGTTWSHQAKLLAGDGAAGCSFGWSVAIEADSIVVGAHNGDDSCDNSGSAYVFVRSDSSWSEEAKLLASDGGVGDYFARSVAIDGNTAVLGAPNDDDQGVDSGSGYVFVRTDSTWSEEAKLLPSDGAPGDEFGYSVAVDGDTAVIGAWYDDDLGADSGSAYVYRFDGYDWVQEAKLLASDGAAGDWFGRSVGISGDTIVVGAYGDDDLGNGYGSAYVFRFDGDNWVQEAKLLPGDAPPGDSYSHPGFGYNVAIDAGTIAVAAQGKDEQGADSGSVYVFVRNGTDWTQQAKLLPSDGATWEYFGQSVAIHGDDIVAGTWGGGSSPTHAGSAYVFVRSGTTWTQQVKLVAPDAAAEDHFGKSVDIDGDTVVGGAYADDGWLGSAYVFVRSGSSWSHQAKLLAGDGAAGDSFGWSVAIEADTIVVGADSDDDSGDSSGSAYVFVRSDSSWSEEAKLLASDGAAGDFFGRSVALDDNTAVVGAPYDADHGPDSGSAYVYEVRCVDVPAMSCELSSNTAAPSTSVTVDLFLEDAVDVRGYQATIAITLTSGSGEVTVPCPSGVAVDENRPDFIFPEFDSENLEPHCPDCGMVVPFCEEQRVAVARVTGSVDVGDTPAYLATFALEVSPDATPGSTFEISIVPYPASILGASDKGPILFEPEPPCELTITSGGQVCGNNVREGSEECDGTDDDDCPGFCQDDCTCPGFPAVSEWGLIVLSLLMLVGGTIVFSQPDPKAVPVGHDHAQLPKHPRKGLSLRALLTKVRNRGPWVLAIMLALANAASASEPCESNADCDDGDVCTFDQCLDSSCSNTPTTHADVAGIDGCGPDGVVDLFDTSAVADGFREAFSEGCSSHNLDLHSTSGCELDGAVDLFDILTVLDAFAGTPNCPCPLGGACCAPPDQCFVSSEVGCNGVGDTFLGNGTTCSEPNLCGFEAGVFISNGGGGGDWLDPETWVKLWGTAESDVPGVYEHYEVAVIQPGDTVTQSSPLPKTMGYYLLEEGATHIFDLDANLAALSVEAFGTLLSIGDGAPPPEEYVSPVLIVRNAPEVLAVGVTVIERMFDDDYCDLVENAPPPFDILAPCVIPTAGAALEPERFDDTTTHRALADVATDNDKCKLHDFLVEQMNITDGIDGTATTGRVTNTYKEWIRVGAEKEDDANILVLVRYLRHFLDPITDAGFWWYPAANVWGTNRIENDWDFNAARTFYFNALTSALPADRSEHMAHTFRAVGQVMHLIQDMGSTAHTRGDPHPSFAPFEAYTSTHFGTVAQMNGLPGITTVPPAADPPRYALEAQLPEFHLLSDFWDTDQWQGAGFDGFTDKPPGLAEYTNYNFFSGDTVFKTDNYPHPSVADTNLNALFPPPPNGQRPVGSGASVPTPIAEPWRALNKTTQAATGIDPVMPLAAARDIGHSVIRRFFDFVLGPFLGPGKNRIEVSMVNDTVMGAHAALILPKVIAYCTDFINYFFRGKVDIRLTWNEPAQNYELRITNRSGEALGAGTWRLFQDDDTGMRTEIAANFNYAGSLAEGASFDADFAATGREGGYTLVFQGTRNETNTAVIGRRFEIGRVHITWEPKSDQDLYMWGPDGSLIAYYSPTSEFGELDNDNIGGNGPENITLKKLTPGRFQFMINYYRDWWKERSWDPASETCVENTPPLNEPDDTGDTCYTQTDIITTVKTYHNSNTPVRTVTRTLTTPNFGANVPLAGSAEGAVGGSWFVTQIVTVDSNGEVTIEYGSSGRSGGLQPLLRPSAGPGSQGWIPPRKE